MKRLLWVYFYRKVVELQEELRETEWGNGWGFYNFSFDGGNKTQPLRALFWEDYATYEGEYLGVKHNTAIECYAEIRISEKEMQSKKGIDKALSRMKKKLSKIGYIYRKEKEQE